MIDTFIASFKTAPTALILDFDATDDRVHGHQEGRYDHGYYWHDCFLPLYVFCGDPLWVSDLRRSHPDAAKHAWSILALLVRRFCPWLDQAERPFALTGEKQRVFGEFRYGAESWNKRDRLIERRVIVKAERLIIKANPHYVVTHRPGDPQALYEPVYCARGERENAIKPPPLDRFADRTGCHMGWANQLRMLLSSLAYILLERLRSLALK